LIPPPEPIIYSGDELGFGYRGPKEHTKDRWKDLWYMTSGELGSDTETPSLEDRTILCVGFASAPNESYYFRKNSPVLPRHLFIDPNVDLIFYNIGFDRVLIEDQFHLEMQGQQDAMIAAGLLGYVGTLDKMAQEFFNQKLVTVPDLLGPKGKDQKRMDEIPEQLMAEKVMQDSEVVLALWWFLKRHIPMKALDLQNRMMPILSAMHRRGILVDQTRLEAHRVETEKQVKFYRGIANAYGFNPGSSNQLGAILMSRGHHISYNRVTKKPILNEDILRSDFKDEPMAHLTLLYRKANVLLSTFINKTRTEHIKEDGRIHPTYSLGVAQTGRIAHSKPNSANYPELMRDIFTVALDHYAVSQDLSQIELRELGYLVWEWTGDRTMMDIMEDSSTDIHSEVANMVGCTRRIAKDINFAVTYGGDEYTLYQKDGLPMDKGAYYIAQYYERFPGVLKLKAMANDQLYKYGYTATRLGNRRGFWDKLNAPEPWKQRAAEREAFNNMVQGSAAETLFEWTWRLREENQVNSIHDDIWDEHEIGRVLRLDANVGLAPFRTPATLKTGFNWAPASESNPNGLREVYNG
jgi:DNA polymerase I